MLEELLEDEHGIRILRRFPTIRLFLAQHGREISQDWWSRTSRSLCKPIKPPSDTVPGLPTSPDAEQQWIASQEHPDAQTFVAQVDATAACQLCPTSIEFTGQASLGRESTSGLVPEQARPGSAYNADVSVHVSWPYRIWRRGKSKPLSLDQSDP